MSGIVPSIQQVDIMWRCMNSHTNLIMRMDRWTARQCCRARLCMRPGRGSCDTSIRRWSPPPMLTARLYSTSTGPRIQPSFSPWSPNTFSRNLNNSRASILSCTKNWRCSTNRIQPSRASGLEGHASLLGGPRGLRAFADPSTSRQDLPPPRCNMTQKLWCLHFPLWCDLRDAA